jgi:peptide/nickel transport system permease protein
VTRFSLTGIGVRIALAAVTLLALSFLVFVATNVLPGDPARQALGHFATHQQIAEYRTLQGLDQPIMSRYVTWLGNLAVGQWGKSLVNQQDIAGTVLPALLRSLVIAGAGFLLALPLAIVLGSYAAHHPRTLRDRGLSVASVIAASLPEFLIALVVLLVLSVWLGWLPVGSSDVLSGHVTGYVAPAVALAIWTFPYLARMVRANVRDVLETPYVRAARLRGIRGWRLMWGHVGPNAALPLVGVVALTAAELVGGVIVIENVFAFPGMGQLLVDSVLGGDYPVIQAITLVIGTAFIGLNVLADMATGVMNPRLREG